MYCVGGWVEFHLAFQIRNMALLHYASSVLCRRERAFETYFMKEYKSKEEIETPLGLIALVHLMPHNNKEPFELLFFAKMEC